MIASVAMLLPVKMNRIHAARRPPEKGKDAVVRGRLAIGHGGLRKQSWRSGTPLQYHAGDRSMSRTSRVFRMLSTAISVFQPLSKWTAGAGAQLPNV
jgi:hypothetical protein